MKCSSGDRRFASAAVMAMIGGVLLLAPTGAEADGKSKDTAAERLLCVHGVSGSTLNVRGGPGLDKPVVATFRRDDCGLSVVGSCDAGWCEMARGDVRGWVDTRYVGVYEVPAKAGEQPAGSVGRSVAAQVRKAPRPRSVQTRYDAARTVGAQLAPSPISNRGYGPIGSFFRMALGATVALSPRPGVGNLACVVGVAPWDTLRIRSGPGVAHDPVGAIPNDACRVHQSGQCRGRWCRVAWRGQTGWVNTFYLE